MPTAGTDTDAPTAWIIATRESDANADVRVWGLGASERLRRSLLAAGVDSVQVLESDQPMPAALGERTGAYVLVREDRLYDDRLISALIEQSQVMLVDGEPTASHGDVLALHVDGSQLDDALRLLRGPMVPRREESLSGVTPLSPALLGGAYNRKLRKLEDPYVFRASSSQVRSAENRIFAASYKGITDLVTKWVFPLPARAVTRLCAQRGWTPNQVTAVSYVLCAFVIWAFATQHFAIGLAAAWGMTFLDTVDGKLARCTLNSSKLGDVADHGLDLVHPPIWWAAWAWGVSATLPSWELVLWIVVGGYVVGRLLEGVFLLAFDQEIFTWRPFDAFFRTIIARRNPNLLLLTAGTAAGRPDLGIVAVAVWTAVCLVVHATRIAQAFAVKRAGQPIRSFHEELEAQAASRTDSLRGGAHAA